MSLFAKAATYGILSSLLLTPRALWDPSRTETPMFDDQQITSLASKKILFGHQSVGENIIQGLRDLISADPRLKLNIVKSADAQSVPAPAFVEFNVGQNGNPQSKIDAFTTVLKKGMGAQGGIAMFKFCYVDIQSSTNISQMADAYRDAISGLKKEFPSLKIVHVTMPLTAEEPAAKAWVKHLLGRATQQELNAKRNQFNDLLRRRYAGIDPIFDLAEIESTHADGSRSYSMVGQERIYTLASEFTIDGGHLNELGRRRAAEQLLLLLAGLDTTSSVAGRSQADRYVRPHR